MPKSLPAPPAPKVDDTGARAAAVAYAREQKRRDRERRRQEAAQETERERRRQAIAKAEAAFEAAKRTHDTKAEEIAAARSALDRQAAAEGIRWNKEKTKLQTALNRAGR